MSVVVVDDDEQILRLFGEYFEKKYKNTICACVSSATTCLQLTTKLTPDLAITDINMPEMSGDCLISEIKRTSHWTRTVAMTGHSIKTGFLAGRCNPDLCIDKGDETKTIFMAIETLLVDIRKRVSCIFPQGILQTKLGDWKKRQHLSNRYGFNISKYIVSQKKLIALALLLSKTYDTKQKLVEMTHYSSFQRMQGSLKDLFNLFDLHKLI